jgi:hypothetical protein
VRKEHSLRVLQNKLLRRISGPKREEVAGGRRTPYNDEIHSLYSSLNRVIKSRRMGWTRYVARLEEMRRQTSIFKT